MAHVLNRSERNYAFWKFLFFFVLSTAMIVGAVYFNFRSVPARANTILRDQVVQYKTQSAAQEKFVRVMDEALLLFDSLQKPGANILAVNLDLASKINEMNDIRYKDSSMYSRLNKNVVDVFSRYQLVTKENMSKGDLPNQLAECKSRNEQIQRDLDDARRDLDIARKNSTNTGF